MVKNVRNFCLFIFFACVILIVFVLLHNQATRPTYQSPVTEISAVLNNGNIPVIRNSKEPLPV